MIYLDNASTTWPKLKLPIDGDLVNAGRGQYKAAAKAGAIIASTRESIKDLLGCNALYETVFTSSATEALNTILQGLDYSNIKTVYVTPFEHNAVIRTIFYLQKMLKYDILYLPVTEHPLEYDLLAIQAQFAQQPPDLLIINHASNVCGLVAPIGEICTLARKYNAVTVLDMAQTAGLVDVNLTDIGVHAAVFAGHKTLYAPFGAAGFVMRKDLPLKPLLYGGTGLHSAKSEMPVVIPERFEAGSRNIQAIAGLQQALAWLKQTGIQTIHDKEQQLKQSLLALLRRFDNITIIGENHGIGIVSCIFRGYAPDEIGRVLDERFDIAVRSGLHCAPRAHELLGTAPAGIVRFSLSYFNEQSDIDQLAEALTYIEKHG